MKAFDMVLYVLPYHICDHSRIQIVAYKLISDVSFSSLKQRNTREYKLTHSGVYFMSFNDDFRHGKNFNDGFA